MSTELGFGSGYYFHIDVKESSRSWITLKGDQYTIAIPISILQSIPQAFLHLCMDRVV